METIRYELDAATRIATLTFDDPAGPVNTMTLQWQADLAEAASRLEADKPRGVLLASAKSTFFAGAALKTVLTLQPSDAPRVFEEIEAIKRSYRRIETLGVPVVALLEGSALGGGFEVALIAHARFALDDPKLQLGLPEVTLGLFPGGTGVVKLTRLLGFVQAQPLLLEGKLLGPREAQSLGLVDGVAPNSEQLRALAMAFIDEHPQVQQPWDRKGWRIPGGGPDDPKVASLLSVAPAAISKKTRGLYPAVQAAFETMVEGARVDYDTATRIESRKLAKVATGQTTKNMIQAFFFDLNAVRSGRSRPGPISKDRPRSKPRRVGILGAGMMGAGIAHACASRGIECVLRDVSLDKAVAGRDAALGKGQGVNPDLIYATESLADLRGCDLVVEAVFEQRDLKASLIRQVEPLLLADGGVFASNTSTLPIGGLSEASMAPERFVGMHFFSPVEKMKLVEIIRGPRTSDDAVARVFDTALALGKIPIVVNDGRGFFTSRVFGAYVMEAATMLAEGIGAPLIEHAALAAGMPVGPLEVLDQTSLALSVHVIEQTRADFAAEGRSYEANAGELLVERMVREFGRAGRAAGGGFYDYPEGGRKRLWPGLKKYFEEGKPVDASADRLQELKDRLLYRQSIETLRCFADGVLTSTHDANIGSIFGIGFPAWTGGVVQFIRSEGVGRFRARAGELAGRFGRRFAVDEGALEAVLRR